jgi:exonuclease SbcD
MRFLHTADWHLGKLLHGVHLTDDQAGVLDQVVELVRERDLDAVIVAGDVYDRSIPPADAVELLDDVLSRLVLDCEVPVVAIAGNHDSPDRLDFGSTILQRQNLHVFSKLRPEPGHVVLEDEHGPVHVLGLPYAEPATARSVFGDDEIRSHDAVTAAQVEAARAVVPEGERSIAIAHVFAQNGLTSDSERTLAVGGAETVDVSRFEAFDYTALGHLHRPQTPAPDVRYSGSLMKYSFSEAGHRKQALVVDLDEAGACTVEPVDLEPERDLRKVEGTMEEILAGPEGDASDYIWVTLTDTGPVVDAMKRIREVYPNALHVERPRRVESTLLQRLEGDATSMSVEEVFEQFFDYATGEEMDDTHREVLEEALDRVREDERSA